MTHPVAPDMPLVSVITIFLDAVAYFDEAVDSVLGQTYPHWELILVDDGSTDGTASLAQDYATRYPDRIRYVTRPNHENRGMSASRNLGIRHARGALVGFLDADDVWLPDARAPGRADGGGPGSGGRDRADRALVQLDRAAGGCASGRASPRHGTRRHVVSATRVAAAVLARWRADTRHVQRADQA